MMEPSDDDRPGSGEIVCQGQCPFCGRWIDLTWQRAGDADVCPCGVEAVLVVKMPHMLSGGTGGTRRDLPEGSGSRPRPAHGAHALACDRIASDYGRSRPAQLRLFQENNGRQHAKAGRSFNDMAVITPDPCILTSVVVADTDGTYYGASVMVVDHDGLGGFFQVGAGPRGTGIWTAGSCVRKASTSGARRKAPCPSPWASSRPRADGNLSHRHAQFETEARHTFFEGPGILTAVVLNDFWTMPTPTFIELHSVGGDEVIMSLSVQPGETVSWSGAIAVKNGVDVVVRDSENVYPFVRRGVAVMGVSTLFYAMLAATMRRRSLPGHVSSLRSRSPTSASRTASCGWCARARRRSSCRCGFTRRKPRSGPGGWPALKGSTFGCRLAPA